MTKYLFNNNPITTLGSSLSSSATTMTVATGTGSLFPSPAGGQYFSVTLLAAGSTVAVPNEIVYCTSRTGDTFTIVRAQEGTTALGWNVGDMVSNDVTAAYLNQTAQITDIQAQTGNFANDTGTANTGLAALNPIPTSYAALLGAPIRVYKVNATNTGAYTLNVNGLGAQSVTITGGALGAGQLEAEHIFEVVWDGTNFELLSPPAYVENSGLALMAPETVKANLTGGTTNPQDVTLASLFSTFGFLGSVTGTNPFYQASFQIPINGGLTLIVNCGTVSSTPGATAVTVTFGAPYTTACIACACSVWAPPGGGGDDNTAFALKAKTTTQAQFTWDSGWTGLQGVSWIAIGY